MPFTTAASSFPRGGDAIQLFAKIGDQDAVTSPSRDLKKTEPSALIALPSVFSHTTFRLIEMLSITQHGAYETRSKQGNHQTIVELGGHIGERHLLNEPELHTVMKLHQQIVESQMRWWRS